MAVVDITPVVLSSADLPEAIEFASNYPHARWYVVKRARALGEEDLIPEGWEDPPAIQLASEAVSTGNLTAGIVREVIRLARIDGLLGEPVILAAINWREWLHPRGRDGQFIEKNSLIDVFGDPMDENSRRRARIKMLAPDGARVSYIDADGNDVPPDPDNGFPGFIPLEDIENKLAVAPKAVARLDTTPEAPVPKQSKEEVLAAWQASPEARAWTQKVREFNDGLDVSPSVNQPGNPLTKTPDHKQIDFSEDLNVPQMYETIRGKQDPGFTVHQKFVNDTVTAAGDAGLTSDGALKNDKGVWSKATMAYKNAVVDELMADLEARGVPKEHRAMMLGGLPGAGKTTQIESYGLDPKKWAIANPDDIKSLMIRDGVYPQIDGLSPMETAGLIHELSSEIAKDFQEEALKQGYNMIADITMGGRPKEDGRTWPEHTADDFKDAGYGLDAVFVDVPLSMSAHSQSQRHLEGVNELRSGRNPEGGRAVPEWVLQRADTGGVPLNKQNFEKMKSDGRFNRWYLVDNTDYDTTPKLIGKGNEPGRVPRYTKVIDPETGRVKITLDEDPADIPGMQPPQVSM